MLLSNAFRPDPRVLKEADTLCNNGFELTIVCWDRQAEFDPQAVLPSGAKIIRVQNVPSGYAIGTRQLMRLPLFWIEIQKIIREIKPDVIHCHDFDTLPAGLFYGFFHRCPVIYDAHEYYAELVRPRLHGFTGRVLGKLIQFAESFGARRARAVVTVDNTLGAIYRKYNHNVVLLGHYPRRGLASTPNPVFSHSTISLVYTGRLSADRGLLVYASLLRKLLEMGIPARLILAGVFSPEQEKEDFFSSAKDILNFIDYQGWVTYEQISAVYHSADIGLAILMPEPRYIAAVPVKLFEYMASGLPVIASNFPATAEIVSEADCGALINPIQDITLTASIIEKWYKDKTIPQVMGENGRTAILEQYNWEKQAVNLINLYRTL